MRRATLAVIVLLGILACAVPARHLNSPVAQAAQAKTQKKEVKVWVNTASGAPTTAPALVGTEAQSRVNT